MFAYSNFVRVLCCAVVLLLGAYSNAQNSSVTGAYKGGLVVDMPELDAGFKLKGRVQMDYNHSSLEDQTVENNAEIRRVWLTLSGYAHDWHFLTRFDVDEGSGSNPLATYIEYRGLGDKAWVSFGRHKESFGMSWVGSIKNVTIPERSAISDRYTLGRSIGFQLRGKVESFYYTVGVFEDGDDESETEAEHIALTARVFAPVIQNTHTMLHLGAGFSKRDARDVYGFELAYVCNRLHVQSEYMAESLDEAGGGLDDSASGIYVEAGYFFTEDSMSYSNGVFTGVKPNASKGAWQVIGRVDSGDGNFSDIQLGNTDATAYTIGLAYYANEFVKVAGSYTQGQEKNGLELSGDEFRIRGQFVF